MELESGFNADQYFCSSTIYTGSSFLFTCALLNIIQAEKCFGKKKIVSLNENRFYVIQNLFYSASRLRENGF
jgi:hypothetical protein